jgi:hypothetical protein
MTKGDSLKPKWCKDQKLIKGWSPPAAMCDCKNSIFFETTCRLSAPSHINIRVQEAWFWMWIYRCLNEGRLDVILDPSALIDKILQGQRCYFYQWQESWSDVHSFDFKVDTSKLAKQLGVSEEKLEGIDWSELITVRGNLVDLEEGLKAKNWNKHKDRLAEAIKEKTGMNGKTYKDFNPLKRAIGVLAISEDMTIYDLTDLYPEFKNLENTHFLKILRGTRECIKRRRILPLK